MKITAQERITMLDLIKKYQQVVDAYYGNGNDEVALTQLEIELKKRLIKNE